MGSSTAEPHRRRPCRGKSFTERNTRLVKSNSPPRMGVVDKLLCNVILNNLRLATNMIAAMNLVASIVGLIICSTLLVGHTAALGLLGNEAESLVHEAVETVSSNNDGRLEELTLVVTSALLGVCVGYILVSILNFIAVQKEKAGLLIPWLIITVLAIVFFAGIGVAELVMGKTEAQYIFVSCSLLCIPIALFQLLVVLALRKELSGPHYLKPLEIREKPVLKTSLEYIYQS